MTQSNFCCICTGFTFDGLSTLQGLDKNAENHLASSILYLHAEIHQYTFIITTETMQVEHSFKKLSSVTEFVNTHFLHLLEQQPYMMNEF